MTLPAPDFQQPYFCEKCGYVGRVGPVHMHPVARKGHMCPYQAIGGERFYSEAQVRGLIIQRTGGGL